MVDLLSVVGRGSARYRRRVGVAALVLSLVAIGVSIASVVYTKRQADAATKAEWRANKPVWAVEIEQQVDERADAAIYRVRNDGPQDLDSVSVHPPKTDDGVRYPVAPVGREWPEDLATEAALGSLAMGQTGRFVLSIGVRVETPEFRVRLVATRGKDTWEEVILLGRPRSRGVQVF
jgi:hypothetical protein